jgi:polyisoprenoid-binding protein YceI
VYPLLSVNFNLFIMTTTKWLADPAHSEIEFKVRHLMITTITGHFRKFDLVVETEDDDFTKASRIVFTAEVDSIDTNNEQRDTHLKSADFFSVAEYPQLRFEGKQLEEKGEGYQLQGNLTIRAVTKPVILDVDFIGIVVDAYGQTKAGFTVDGKIRRKEFNLTWDAVTEAGQVVVSNDIRLHAEIQLIKQQVETTRAKTEAVNKVEA